MSWACPNSSKGCDDRATTLKSRTSSSSPPCRASMSSFLLFLLFFVLSPVLAQVQPVTPSTPPTVTAAAPTSSTIPSSAPAGGLTMTAPGQNSDASYYKIAPAVNVTFGWNFTSVLSYGTSLTVQAFCSNNANTYTITRLPATATEVVWNPYSYSIANVARGSAALVQDKYRLQIFDERGLYAGSSPGLMSPNDDTEFALYIPQAYTPLASGWTCSACTSGAFGLRSSPLLVGIVVVALTMLLSCWTICLREGTGRSAIDA